ncbi:helix-turn-helix domain-containing protein [Rhizobium sullae]|uniref:helix-turn-helix domain-containing protein n=1 Tax=Rhizobium sullae TaxID=50338 RepID=UPI0015C5C2F2
MSQKQPPPGLTFFKALCLAPISGQAKAAGCALFDHYNFKTAQCDPSATSLARRLGIDRRTIFDAINELEQFGLFARRPHGGNSSRNSYSPNFPLASLIVKDFEGRRKSGVEPAETSHMHPNKRPPKRSRRAKNGGDAATTFGRQNSGNGPTLPSGTCAPAPGGTVAPQTLLKNPLNLTLGRARPEISHQSDGGSLTLGPRVQTAPRPPPPRPPRAPTRPPNDGDSHHDQEK